MRQLLGLSSSLKWRINYNLMWFNLRNFWTKLLLCWCKWWMCDVVNSWWGESRLRLLRLVSHRRFMVSYRRHLSILTLCLLTGQSTIRSIECIRPYYYAESLFAAQAITCVATHFSVAYSVCRSLCLLSHSCTLLKPFGGCRCYLANTLVGSIVLLDCQQRKERFENEPLAKICNCKLLLSPGE